MNTETNQSYSFTGAEVLIAHIKELQREYHEGSAAYNVLRQLEVSIPNMFAPKQEAKTAEDISVITGQIVNCEGTLYMFAKDNKTNDIVPFKIYKA